MSADARNGSTQAMALQPAARRVIETRFGRYEVAVIPMQWSEIPGFDATRIQAVPQHGRAVHLVVFERSAGHAPTDFPRAA